MSGKKKFNKKGKTKPASSKHKKPDSSFSTVKTENLEYLKKIHDLESQIKLLQEDKEARKNEMEKIKESIIVKTESTTKFQKMIYSLQKEVTDLLQDLDTADEEINEYLKVKDELTLRNEYLQKELSDKEQLLIMRNKQFENLAQNYEQIYKKIIDDEKQRKSKKTKKKSSKRTTIDSLSQLQDQVKQIDKLERKLKSKDEEIDELINRLEIQEIKIEELEEEIENELKSRLRLEKAYNKMKGQI